MDRAKSTIRLLSNAELIARRPPQPFPRRRRDPGPGLRAVTRPGYKLGRARSGTWRNEHQSSARLALELPDISPITFPPAVRPKTALTAISLIALRSPNETI